MRGRSVFIKSLRARVRGNTEDLVRLRHLRIYLRHLILVADWLWLLVGLAFVFLLFAFDTH